jgi:hypothetical protein
MLALALAGAMFDGHGAVAQTVPAQVEPQPAAPPEPAPADPSYKPGFIDAIGRWFEEGRAKFDSRLKDANDKMLELHNKAQNDAKEAAGAIVLWPNVRVMSGRERCEVAANGAPDCRTAATALCRGKGFQDGKPFDTQSEDRCPSRAVLSGRGPDPGACKTETFVTRAVCQ